MALTDPHSYFDDAQPKTTRVELDLHVDFDARVVSGTATLHLDRPAAGRLDLDTRALTIHEVKDAKGTPVPFELHAPDPIKGSRLSLALTGPSVTLRYQTAKDATALQWLEPPQTAGKQHPYVFTQCQAIHARSVFPCQDTPWARIRYTARLEIPRALRAVMAAAHVGRSEGSDGRAVESFAMEQPIPPYLFAFAAGNIAQKDLDPRCRVHAEPEVLDAAAWEFAEVGALLQAGEKLFGPYDWERFDLLVMPPSFPYGGMENPRLTFLTPTLLAGDRSQVSVVGHELAHSWTGNLVTNATMAHFWLNEGFTTYAERRIVEAHEGGDIAQLHAALGRRGLEQDLRRFGEAKAMTRLRTKLDGVDPDEVYSRVPYEKGYLFLRRIEEAVGRARFDAFLKQYIARYRFQSITTEDFERLIDEVLPEARKKVDFALWIDGEGLPADAPAPVNARLSELEALAAGFTGGARPGADAGTWTSLDWQIYLAALPEKLPIADVEQMEERFHFSQAKNAEIKMAWLATCARSGYTAVQPAIRDVLGTVGRMKYLRPIYLALLSAGPESARFARATFDAVKDTYHPVSRAVVEGLLSAKTAPAA